MPIASIRFADGRAYTNWVVEYNAADQPTETEIVIPQEETGLGKTYNPVLDTANPLHFNAYTYSLNNPATHSDPDREGGQRQWQQRPHEADRLNFTPWSSVQCA